MNIDRDWLTHEAAELGFERAAVCRADAVSSIYDRWIADMRESDFSHLSKMPTYPRTEMPDAQSVLLVSASFKLFEEYPEDCARVSGYYFAANRAYRNAALLIEKLQVRGARAALCAIPIKPLAQALGFGEYGGSTLIVRDGAHQLFQLIVTDADIEPTGPLTTPAAEAVTFDSGRYCPVGALENGRLHITQCLRNHMMRGSLVPEQLRRPMGTRLLGCDECTKVYPSCAHAELPDGYADLFSFETLLNPALLSDLKESLTDAIGANYARQQNILAQAAIAAGNATDGERYLPLLAPLAKHENSVIAEHAAWAITQINSHTPS